MELSAECMYYFHNNIEYTINFFKKIIYAMLIMSNTLILGWSSIFLG